MLELAVKLNTGFSMTPFSFFKEREGNKPTKAEVKIRGLIYSLIHSGASCQIGYTAISKKLKVSKSTVSRTVNKLKAEGLLKVQREGGKATSYACDLLDENLHIRTPYFFHTEQFDVRYKYKDTIYEEKRTLTSSEVGVLALIYTYTNYQKAKGYTGSTREIAERLHLSMREVRYILQVLLYSKLVFRREKGVNLHKNRSKFVANMKLFRPLEKKYMCEYKTSTKVEPSQWQKDLKDTNARIERQAYYERLREEAERKADKWLDKANQDARFVKVEKDLRICGLEIVKSEHYKKDNLMELKDKELSLKLMRAKILNELGIKELYLQAETFAVCPKCKDSGYLTNGMQCDCYHT